MRRATKCDRAKRNQGKRFLSTLSLRRATVYPGTWSGSILISIHALLAESDGHPPLRSGVAAISIHALLAESDSRVNAWWAWANLFLSTLSLRRATPKRRTKPWQRRNFYPRSPCGERHFISVTSHLIAIFLSTLSLRRATVILLASMLQNSNFYPRSPCGERQTCLAYYDQHRNFYPRSPCGERQALIGLIYCICMISIHALLAESD